MWKNRVRWRISLDNNFQIIPIFATPLYESFIRPITEEEKQLIVDLQYSRMPSGNGFFTTNKYILELPELTSLKEELMSKVYQYTKDGIQISSNSEFYIINSWAVKHDPEDFAMSHQHRNSIFSGCVYIDVDSSTGAIQFYKPPTFYNCLPHTIHMDVDVYNIFNADSWEIKPENNKIVMFPSHLSHAVLKNKSNKPRYSLAFNVFVKGTFGTEDTLDVLTLY